MKKIVLFLILTGLVFTISAQDDYEEEYEEEYTEYEDENNDKDYDLFNVGINVDIQYIQSDDINNYMANELSGYVISGSSDIYLLFEMGLNFRVRPLKFFGVRAGGEFYIAPKIVINGPQTFYSLFGGSIYSVGTFYIPISKVSILFAAGPEFHFTKFEDYFGYGFGVRGEFGVAFFNKEISILIRYAEIEDRDFPNFKMNLTGVGLRAAFFF